MDEQSLIEYVTRQRWYGAKSRTVSHSEVLDTVTIRQTEPQLSLALVEMRFDTGAHDIYQLLVSGGDEGAPSDGPANGPAGTPNFLHSNPLPNTPGGGRTNECEAGNEPWTPDKVVVGNVPGNQGIKTEKTKRSLSD